MRHTTKLLAALGVLALMLALAGCGGSDSSSGDSTSATSGAQSTDTTGSGQGVGGPNTQEGSSATKGGDGSTGDSGAAQKTAQAEGGQGSGGGKGSMASVPKPKSHFKAPPVKVTGGGSSQFVVKGGDNSIQEYGEEGSGSELQEVAGIVHDFLATRAEEKWEAACSYLAKSNVESLQKLASQSPQFKGASCGAILAAFTRSPLPASVQREITAVDAGSFRHEGEQGFLIYRGGDKTVYAMPMHSEGGAWKVAALSGAAIG